MWKRIYKEEIVLRVVLICSLIGAVIASYLTYEHFTLRDLGICPTGGCEIVWNTDYALFLGVPVALIGLLGFIILFCLAYVRLYFPSNRFSDYLPSLLLLFAIAGAIFSLYLTFVEIFAIHAICDWCFVCFVLMIIMWSSIIYAVPKASSENA